jgi:hypothetical protein
MAQFLKSKWLEIVVGVLIVLIAGYITYSVQQYKDYAVLQQYQTSKIKAIEEDDLPSLTARVERLTDNFSTQKMYIDQNVPWLVKQVGAMQKTNIELSALKTDIQWLKKMEITK